MENTQQLLQKARQDLIDDMKARNIGAIIWDNSTAGFQYLPVATLGPAHVVNITGLYRNDDTLYLIEEDNPRADIDDYYDHDTEVKPTVVCLTESVARGDLGDPLADGYTTEASIEEWLAIADCYFQALAE